jgi:hypothetical protein
VLSLVSYDVHLTETERFPRNNYECCPAPIAWCLGPKGVIPRLANTDSILNGVSVVIARTLDITSGARTGGQLPSSNVDE